MSNPERGPVPASAIDALDGVIRGTVTDSFVANAEDLAAVVLARSVILQYGLGLDTTQRVALAKVAATLDKARAKQSTVQRREPARLADQHLIELSREETLTRVAELLETALRTASEAGIELRITVDRCWSSLIDAYDWRVIVRSVPARPAHRTAA